jgi:hypothetical protein
VSFDEDEEEAAGGGAGERDFREVGEGVPRREKAESLSKAYKTQSSPKRRRCRSTSKHASAPSIHVDDTFIRV